MAQENKNFSITNSYAKNEYCLYSGKLYKFTKDKSAGAWDSSYVIKTTVVDELYTANTSTNSSAGYDVTLSLPASSWQGSESPYAQTVSAPGMTATKGVVFTQITENAIPTDDEKINYMAIAGVVQGPDSVTFYATKKPTIDITIRAFCGAGTEKIHDLCVVEDAFDSSHTYKIDDYCIYGDKLYKFTKSKNPGSWDETSVKLTNICAEMNALSATEFSNRVSALETAVNKINDKISNLGDQVTYTLDGTKLTIIPKLTNSTETAEEADA